MITLNFDGIDDYIEIADDARFSVATTGRLTVAAWMRPDVLAFSSFESTGYVHWLGKGEIGQQEWTFRMYNETTTDIPARPNRISFYVFNLQGGLGIGSYFQEPIQAGEWIHVTGIADGQNTAIYKNGVLKSTRAYSGIITPEHGDAPLRIGTRDLNSFCLGAIRGVRIWSRALEASEVKMVANDSVPQEGLAAEYRLDQHVALDSANFHLGHVHGGSWESSEP